MRVWTCQRRSKGERCGHKNPSRYQLCRACGKRKPARRAPAHMAALKLAYEVYLALNDRVHGCGERCAIEACGKRPAARRRLDRDHDHTTGRPRGLLCHRCNRALPAWMTPSWLRAAADYLDRAAAQENA